MNNITEKVIDTIIEYELNSKPYTDIYLQHGLIGSCIFSYWYTRENGIHNYDHIINGKIQHIAKAISSSDPLEIDNGLLGVALGFLYCNNKGFIDMDIDSCFQEIDAQVYKVVMSNISHLTIDSDKYDNLLSDLIDCQFYLSIRLSLGLKQNEIEREIMSQLLMLILNKIYMNHDWTFYEEPLPPSASFNLSKFIFMLASINKSNIGNNRIKHIVEELKLKVIKKYPYCQLNCLYLYLALCELSKSMDLDQEWLDYIVELKEKISLNSIFNTLINNNSLLGSSGLLYAYGAVKFFSPELLNDLNMIALEESIKNNDIWNDFHTSMQKKARYGIGGIDGPLGLIMVLNDIKKRV